MMPLLWHLAFLRDLLAHKALVIREGRKLDVPLPQLLVHDLSKLRPDEYFASVRFEHAPRPLSAADRRACDAALELHRRRNPHHPEYWLQRTQGGEVQPAPMPDRYRREMLADWRAVGSAKGTSTLTWYRERFDRERLHPDTRTWVEEQISR